MKKLQIQPVNIWINGENRSASELIVYNFHNYNFDGTDSLVSYKLGASDIGGASTDAQFVSYSEGSVVIPDAIVQTWGTDDDPIIDYVLASLNLEEA